MADFRPFTPEEVPAAAAPEEVPAARNTGFSHPPFNFKYEGTFPDALKIKKKLNLGPFQLSLAGVWERKSREFYSKVSVKVRTGSAVPSAVQSTCHINAHSSIAYVSIECAVRQRSGPKQRHGSNSTHKLITVVLLAQDRIVRGKFSFRADDPTIEYK
jgi:hypothetical protein